MSDRTVVLFDQNLRALLHLGQHGMQIARYLIRSHV